jgi:stage III sporulation protein AG
LLWKKGKEAVEPMEAFEQEALAAGENAEPKKFRWRFPRFASGGEDEEPARREKLEEEGFFGLRRSEATGVRGKKIAKKLGRTQKIVLAVGLLGLVLLCLSSLPGKKSSGSGGSVSVDLTKYEQEMERRLCETITAIDGVGQTRVMLTLDCGSEPIYAMEGKQEKNSSIIGETAEANYSAQEEYVIIGSGAGQQGLVLKTLEPRARGVAVLCEGADDLTVRQKIIEACTAVLGIGSNKVSVARIAAAEE